MNIILQSSIETLQKAKFLLNGLRNDDLSNHSIPPYYSSIGSHLRHILEFYDCIFNGLTSKYIDLIDRKRDERIHCDCNYALVNIDRVINKLGEINETHFSNVYLVNDNLGLGEVKINYTLGAILAQANSHTIHHYAIIGYILDRLNLPIQGENFGYNPTTPKTEINLS